MRFSGISKRPEDCPQTFRPGGLVLGFLRLLSIVCTEGAACLCLRRGSSAGETVWCQGPLSLLARSRESAAVHSGPGHRAGLCFLARSALRFGALPEGIFAVCAPPGGPRAFGSFREIAQSTAHAWRLNWTLEPSRSFSVWVVVCRRSLSHGTTSTARSGFFGRPGCGFLGPSASVSSTIRSLADSSSSCKLSIRLSFRAASPFSSCTSLLTAA